MNTIPDYCSQSTRQAAEAIAGRISQAQACLAAAQHAAEQARQADPMTADVDQVLAAGDNLRKATVEHLRTMIAIEQDRPSLIDQLVNDCRAALQAAEFDLQSEDHAIRQTLVEIGFGGAIETTDAFGVHPFDAIIASNSRIWPLKQRVQQLKLELAAIGTTRQTHKRELDTLMLKLRQEFDQAANGTSAPAKPRRVTIQEL